VIDVVLNCRCIRKLRHELAAAGSNEIGGVLAAEQVGDGRFLVVDLSVQRNGTSSHFVRDPVQHREFIRRFHARTGYQPDRFNYLGEWHSHPSYPTIPSKDDFRQMQTLVEDEEQKSTFLVLMIVKLDMDEKIWGSTYGFRPAFLPVRGRLHSIDEGAVKEEYRPMIVVSPNIEEKYDAD
jgi:proteasome lid subunit RPN8/RPN11